MRGGMHGRAGCLASRGGTVIMRPFGCVRCSARIESGRLSCSSMVSL